MSRVFRAFWRCRCPSFPLALKDPADCRHADRRWHLKRRLKRRQLRSFFGRPEVLRRRRAGTQQQEDHVDRGDAPLHRGPSVISARSLICVAGGRRSATITVTSRALRPIASSSSHTLISPATRSSCFTPALIVPRSSIARSLLAYADDHKKPGPAGTLTEGKGDDVVGEGRTIRGASRYAFRRHRARASACPPFARDRAEKKRAFFASPGRDALSP